MSQAQLMVANGERREGEGSRKRVKITVPHFDNSDLIKTYSKTVVGRCMNPEEQDTQALVIRMPKIWKMEDRVVGADLGFGRFQFDFEEEEDIETVFNLQPFHFDYWMVSLARWQPRQPPNFPSEIPFWVKVVGVPLEFWAEQTFESIGRGIGRFVEADVDFGRVLIVVDGNQELIFDTTVDFSAGEFHEGEEALISLRYERLFGYCSICFSLCHDMDVCPLNKNKKSVEKSKPTRDMGGGGTDSGRSEKAQSYKGAVVRGHDGYQPKERGNRDYYGKGKGKVGEEEMDHRRGTGPERDERRYNNKSGHRRDEEVLKQRSARWEVARATAQSTEAQKVLASRNRERTVTLEEGEVHSKRVQKAKEDVIMKETALEEPSLEFQRDLLNTQEQPLVAGVKCPDQEDVRVVRELSKIMGGFETGQQVAKGGEEFQDLTDEETVVESLDQVVQGEMMEEEKGGELNEDLGKKQGLKKRPARPTVVTGASLKMRMVHGLASPRKKTTSKTEARKGDGSKQMEAKGALIPKPQETNP